jgi:hypothetical protein
METETTINIHKNLNNGNSSSCFVSNGDFVCSIVVGSTSIGSETFSAVYNIPFGGLSSGGVLLEIGSEKVFSAIFSSLFIKSVNSYLIPNFNNKTEVEGVMDMIFKAGYIPVISNIKF